MSSPERPVASVIVPTHRGRHRLAVLLEHLAAQETQEPWQVVVVVDGLLDDTPGLLDAWRDRLALRVVTLEHARGVAAALTAGFDAAEGDVLIRCDDDLGVPPHFVSGHVRAHGEHRERVVLSLTRDVFADSAYARAYGIAANARGLAAYYAQRPELRWQHLAACFSLHRDLWAESGGFDPAFAYGEDSEFGYRLWRNGAEFVIDPTLEVVHRGPSTSAATRVPRSFVSGASRRRFRRVHPGALPPDQPPDSIKAWLWHLAVSTLARTVRTPRGYQRVGAVLQALVERVPTQVGGRLVAWGVEAAARSGQRFGVDDLHSYRSQKEVELSRELRQGDPAHSGKKSGAGVRRRIR